MALYSFASQAAAQEFNTRNDYLGLGGSEVGWAIERTATGYLAYHGYSPDTVLGARVAFTSLGPIGVVLSSWSYGRDTVNITPGWANTLDGANGFGYFGCGATDEGGTNHALVWHFAANGDSLWTTVLFPDSGYRSLGWMAKGLNDGSVVATGTVYAPGTEADIFLSKLDPFGQVLWSRTYGASGIDKGYSVDLMLDGGFVIGGYTTSYGAGGHDTYLIRTDSGGNQLWHRWFGGVENDCIGNVTVASNGDVVISGCEMMYTLGSLPYFRSQEVRLTAGGTQLWNKLIGPTDYINGRWCSKELPNGSFVAPGAVAGPQGFPHGSLLKFNANGDSLWMRTYTHPSVTGNLDWHEFRDVVVEPDGGVTACGFLVDATNQDLWVIRVDSFGCLVPGCQLYDQLNELALDLHVLAYPNPTTGRLYLSFRSAQPPTGTFQLLDGVGRSIRQFRPGSSSVEIDLDISDLPAGLYVIQYTDEVGVRWNERIVKQ